MHFDTLDRLDVALLVADDFNGICQEQKLYALLFCMVDFLFSCRHFLSASAVDEFDVRPHTQSRSRTIHSNVACAHNNHVFTAFYGGYRIIFVGFHEIDSRQILVCGVHSVEVFALDFEEHGNACARAYKHRVVFKKQFFDKYRLANDDVGFYINA